MRLPIILIFSLFLFLGSCSSSNTEEKILGAWAPEYNTWESFIFFTDSAWVFERDSIITYSYKIDGEELKFFSPYKKKQDVINPIDKQNILISQLKDDSLILHLETPFGDEGLEVSYQKIKLLTKRFDKIQFSFFNGWQRGRSIEIDSAGNFTAWENNAWTEKTYKITGVLEKPEFIKVLWGANYLYSLPPSFLKFSNYGCDDCFLYGISLYKAGSVKSFYVSESRKPSIADLVFSTLLSVMRNSEKVETKSSPPMLYSNKYLSKDTIVIDKQ